VGPSAQRPWCLKWDLRPLRCLLGAQVVNPQEWRW
jgi:hypothetical protein